MRPRTYREAGVDVALARRFVKAIQPLARPTRREGLVRGIGGFGGLFEIGRRAPRDAVLVASTDGVGTKLRLAQQAGRFAPLGVDLVAMNVNDILCAGAEPLFFLDYIAVGRLKPGVLMEVIRGIVRGCVESGCVLLGGETAQMGLVYAKDDFDLAGFAVGVVSRRGMVTGEGIRAGDPVLGLASSGLHANGFTLVQKVFSVSEQKRLSRELLRPTRIYVRPVLDLLRRGLPVRGIAHITGGSFKEKLPRILPPGVGVRIQKRRWPVPTIFRKVQAQGVSEAEMYRTFNMGIGMALVLPARQVAAARKALARHSVPSWVIGEATQGHREVLFV